MIGLNKRQTLQKYLTDKTENNLSKQLSCTSKFNYNYNKSAKTSPNSYNDRNLKKNLSKNDEDNNFFIGKEHLFFRHSKTTNKTCYNNINLLPNFKENEEENYNNINTIMKDKLEGKDTIKSNKSINIPKYPKYDKSIFHQIIKYYTIKSKNEPIKFEDMSKILSPIKKLIMSNNSNYINESKANYSGKKKEKQENIVNVNKTIHNNTNLNNKNIKIKNVNISLVNINNIENGNLISKKSNSNFNNLNQNAINSNITKGQNPSTIVSTPKTSNNYCIRSSTNDTNKNYIGVDENFNLTFGKSSNRIEMMTSSTNNNSNNINSLNSIGNNINLNTVSNTNSNSNTNNSISKNNDNIYTTYVNNITESYRNIRAIALEKNFKEEEKIIDNNNNLNSNRTGKNTCNSNGKNSTNLIIETPTFVNNNSNTITNCRGDDEISDEEEINRSRTSYQFRPRRMKIPKNGINLASLKLNNQIMQSILNKKNNNNSQKNMNNNTKTNKINDIPNCHSDIINKGIPNNFGYKIGEKKININLAEELKINKNNNFQNINHFNRDFSGKKKSKL